LIHVAGLLDCSANARIKLPDRSRFIIRKLSDFAPSRMIVEPLRTFAWDVDGIKPAIMTAQRYNFSENNDSIQECGTLERSAFCRNPPRANVSVQFRSTHRFLDIAGVLSFDRSSISSSSRHEQRSHNGDQLALT